MSRKDKQQAQQLSKLGDAIAKGLRRGDAELAAAELLRLPQAAREPWLAAVRQLVPAAVQTAHQQKIFAKLHAWAVKITDDNRLLPPTAPQRQQVAWSLLWGAVQQHDWQRVAAIRQLVPRLTMGDDAATLSLVRWLDGEGEPDSAEFTQQLPVSLLEIFGRVQPATAPLKIDDSGWTRPHSVQEVTDAVLFCMASLPWPRFAVVALGWLQRPTEELDLAIAQCVARLALAQALRLHLARDTHWAHPWQILADLAERIAPQALPEPDLFRSLRLAQTALGAEFDVLEGPPVALKALLILCKNNPQLLTVSSGLLARANFSHLDHLDPDGAQAFERRQRSLEQWQRLSDNLLANHTPAAGIWFALRMLWRDEDPCRVAFWSLQQACRQALTQPNELKAAWPSLPEQARMEILSVCSRCLAVDLASQMYDCLWLVADQRDREGILHGVIWLVEKSSLWIPERKAGSNTNLWRKAAEAARFELHCDAGDFDACDAAFQQLGPEFAELLDIPQLVDQNRLVVDGGPLSAAGRAIWQHFEQNMLELGKTALEMGYHAAENGLTKNRTLLAWLDRNRTLDGYKDCIELASDDAGMDFGEFDRASIDLLLGDAAGCAALLLEAAQREHSEIEQDRYTLAFIRQLDDHVGQWSPDMLEARILADKLLEPKLSAKRARKKPVSKPMKGKSPPQTP